MFDIEPRTLFVYESENLIAPERTPTQRRRYSRRDIERIRRIRELTTVHGINLAGVKVIFSLMEAAVQGRLQIPETEFPELAGARHLWACAYFARAFSGSSPPAFCVASTSMAPSRLSWPILTGRRPPRRRSPCSA